MKARRLHFAFLATLTVPALCNLSSAQSVYGLDGAASFVVEQTGPGDPVCGYPVGPVLSGFPAPIGFPCPTAVAFGPPPGILGDVAVDKVTDTVWVTDGFLVTQYAASAVPGVAPGAALTSYLAALPAGAPLTGLGWDAGLGALWMTDGALVWAEVPPPPPGCGLAGFFVVLPFPVPTATGTALTDVAWDPLTGSLFLSEAGGVVSNFFPGGFPGPFPPFPAAACGPVGALQGVTVDIVASVALGIPVLYVTDGFLLAHLDAFGAPAPPSFHSPFPCVPTAGPLLGLAYAERALPFGAGADNMGLPAPTIGSIGQALSPNPGFTTTLTGSLPGSAAGLYLSTTGFNCPPIVVLGGLIPVYPFPVGAAFVAIVPTDPLGNVVLATPIPPGLPPGTGAWVQWVAATPAPSLQVSEGLSIVIGLP